MFGQIARDLVLVVDAVPTASRSADVYQRRELLGGKGANQAVGLAQLGLRPALAGVRRSLFSRFALDPPTPG